VKDQRPVPYKADDTQVAFMQSAEHAWSLLPLDAHARQHQVWMKNKTTQNEHGNKNIYKVK
jgi:hypothetical protein